MLSTRGYGGFELAIIRNGGSIVSGPFTRKLPVTHGTADHIVFRHDGREYVLTFDHELHYYLWLAEVAHEHGVRHPNWDYNLGRKQVKLHLIKYNEFNTRFPQLLNQGHEKEATEGSHQGS